jgi:phage shock protein A
MVSFFQRVNDIINSNINDLLDRLEDPERMIKQIIREMEENISQSKEGVIEAIAREKQLLKELESHRRQSQSWQEKAQTALEAEKEDLARAALARKKEIDAVIANLEPAWESAYATSERLKTQLRKLENKLEDAKRKRSALLARQRAAEARQQMGRTLNKFQVSLDAQTKFDHMEDKIADMEARTEAAAELEDDSSALERELLQMEIDQDVEAELKALKIKIKQKE